MFPGVNQEDLKITLMRILKRELGTLADADVPTQFEHLSHFHAKWMRSVSYQRELLDQYTLVFDRMYQKLAAQYLHEKLRDDERRKLNSLAKEIADPQFRKVVYDEVVRNRKRFVLHAVQHRIVTWDSVLRRELLYCPGMDERVIELPLALEIANLAGPGRVLDAGASLNVPFLRDFIGCPVAYLTHFTQSGEREEARLAGDRVSYYFGDLRDTPFKDETFDRIVCISTIEHIGMDNRRYGASTEQDPASAFDAFREMLRLLAPGGRLLLSFPYGVAADFGWFRVFDATDIQRLDELSVGAHRAVRYFTYDGHWFEDETEGRPPAVSSSDEAEAITGLAMMLITKPRTNGGLPQTSEA